MEKLKVLTKNGFKEIDKNEAIEKLEKGEYILGGEDIIKDLIYEPTEDKPFYETISIYPHDNRLMMIIKDYIIENKIDIYDYYSNFKTITDIKTKIEFNNLKLQLYKGGAISYEVFKLYLDVFNLYCEINISEKRKLTPKSNKNDEDERTLENN